MEMKPPDEHIRRHLLGLALPDERDQVESFLMTEIDASDAFDIAEQELAEAFVRGELDPEEARAFEATLLPRPEVRARVELIRYLIAAGRRKETRTSTRSQRFALAAVLLIGIAAGATLLLSPAPLDPSNAGAPAVDTPTAGAIQTLRLTEGVMRSSRAPSVPTLVADRHAIIEIPLHEGDRFTRYRVILRQGEEIRSEAVFTRPPGPFLRLEVAAQALAPGSLQVILQGTTGDGWMAVEMFEIASMVPTPNRD